MRGQDSIQMAALGTSKGLASREEIPDAACRGFASLENNDESAKTQPNKPSSSHTYREDEVEGEQRGLGPRVPCVVPL
jgi:hypothetical protein